MLRLGKRADALHALQKKVHILVIKDGESETVMFGSTILSEVEEYRRLVVDITGIEGAQMRITTVDSLCSPQ